MANDIGKKEISRGTLESDPAQPTRRCCPDARGTFKANASTLRGIFKAVHSATSCSIPSRLLPTA